MSGYTFATPAQYLRERKLVHLIAVGDMPGTPAGELRAGDCLMWNFGSVYQVTAVREASPKFMEITERATKGGEEYKRRLRKDRLVVRLTPTQARRAVACTVQGCQLCPEHCAGRIGPYRACGAAGCPLSGEEARR